MSKTFYVQTITTSGHLTRERAIAADDAREAAQLYLHAEHYADVSLVGRYESHGAVRIGQVSAVGGWHYRAAGGDVRVVGGV